MNRYAIVGPLALAAVIGCSSQSDPVSSQPDSGSAVADAVVLTETVERADGSTLVALKVPNMV